MRESMVFYKSFYEALNGLPPEAFKEVMCAVIEYALYDKEPEKLDGIANMAFLLIKPQIDANNKRYKNGAKGGRPKKPTVSENKTNGYEVEKPNVNDNVNVNENENDNDLSQKDTKKTTPIKHKYGEYNNVLLSDDELEKLKTEYSDYEERIERLSAYIASKGVKYKSHYATIRNWARKDKKEKAEKKGTTGNYENITRNIGTWI